MDSAARSNRYGGIFCICMGAFISAIVYVRHAMGYPLTIRHGYMDPIQGYIGSAMLAALGIYCIWRNRRGQDLHARRPNEPSNDSREP